MVATTRPDLPVNALRCEKYDEKPKPLVCLAAIAAERAARVHGHLRTAIAAGLEFDVSTWRRARILACDTTPAPAIACSRAARSMPGSPVESRAKAAPPLTVTTFARLAQVLDTLEGAALMRFVLDSSTCV